MVVYTVTTLALVAGLDLRLAVLVVIWIAAFGLLAKLYLPAIRKHDRVSVNYRIDRDRKVHSLISIQIGLNDED